MPTTIEQVSAFAIGATTYVAGRLAFLSLAALKNQRRGVTGILWPSEGGAFAGRPGAASSLVAQMLHRHG